MSSTTALFEGLRPAQGALTTKALSKRIGERTLWRDLDLIFEPGTLTAITGPSGAGKTTLLNALGLLEPITFGHISYGKDHWSGLSQRQIRALYRETIGFLFQNYALVEQWSIRRNFRLALSSMGTPRAEHAGLIAAALAAVGLSGREEAAVHTLSGGEQQRVAIARLLTHRPQVILADEPTAALDKNNAETVVGHLRRFAQAGAIVVISTHNPATVEATDRRIDLATTGK